MMIDHAVLICLAVLFAFKLTGVNSLLFDVRTHLSDRSASKRLSEYFLVHGDRDDIKKFIFEWRHVLPEKNLKKLLKRLESLQPEKQTKPAKSRELN